MILILSRVRKIAINANRIAPKIKLELDSFQAKIAIETPDKKIKKYRIKALLNTKTIVVNIYNNIFYIIVQVNALEI